MFKIHIPYEIAYYMLLIPFFVAPKWCDGGVRILVLFNTKKLDVQITYIMYIFYLFLLETTKYIVLNFMLFEQGLDLFRLV